MPDDNEKKLNDQIAFCNSKAIQFDNFAAVINREVAELKVNQKELTNLINANRNWIKIVEDKLKALDKEVQGYHTYHTTPKTEEKLKPEPKVPTLNDWFKNFFK